MQDGTKRTLRTAYASVVAFLTAAPVVVFAIPAGVLDAPTAAHLAAFAAWTVTVNKVINALEDRGVIPAWLRDANQHKEN